MVAYQLWDMCVKVDWSWEETQLVHNHIKSALEMEKGDMDYIKAYEDRMDEIVFQFDCEDLVSKKSLRIRAKWDEREESMPGLREEGENK